MNYKAVFYILGKIFSVIGVLMLLPVAVSLYYKDNQHFVLLFISALLMVFGTALTIKKPENMGIYTKEGLVICGLGWVLMSAFGALPFYLSGMISSYLDAFFEACSGFSTTGATILTQIEGLPQSLLFWRSFTHWIGGMGILSFFIAFIPKGAGHSMYVMKAEVPGPKAGKVVSKIQESARILYIIYIVLTILETAVLYFFTDMHFYDSVVTAFSTAGTGGFSVLNNSVSGYASPAVEWILSVFMFLFAVNLNLYFYIIIRKFSLVFKNEELWAYISINAGAVVLITISLLRDNQPFSDALRNAVFNVNSIMSTTGFCTVDFNEWSSFAKTILLLIMLVGGCAGSTGGGIKVTRIVLYFKELLASIKKSLKPRSITKIRMNGNKVENEIISGINTYLVIFCMITALSMLLISLNGFDMETTATSVISCIANVGPGIGAVGPTGNYADFSAFSKLVFCFDMLAGRLDFFPILILFNPNTYKK